MSGHRSTVSPAIAAAAVSGSPIFRAAFEVAQVAEARAHEHRQGFHDGYGNARRDCPLCR